MLKCCLSIYDKYLQTFLCVYFFFCLLEQAEKPVRTKNLFKPIIIRDMAVLAHMASRIPENYIKSIVCKQIYFMFITADILFPQNWSF